MFSYEGSAQILVVRKIVENMHKIYFFSGLLGKDCEFKRGRVYRVPSFREDRLQLTKRKHTALTWFTKFRIYWDEEITGCPRVTSAIDDFMMRF